MRNINRFETKYRLICFLIIFINLGSASGQNTNPKDLYQGYSSLHIGPLYNQSKGSLIDSLNHTSLPYKTQIVGIGATIENSFLLDYFRPQPHKKFRWGDTFLASLGAGWKFSPNLATRSDIWGSYRFEIGLLGDYVPSQNRHYRIHWVPLIYAKDEITPNISGSSLSLELWTLPVLLGATITARNARILGFLSALTQPKTNNHDYTFFLGYRIKKSNEILVKALWFHPDSNLSLDKDPNQRISSDLSIQIAYGLLF